MKKPKDKTSFKKFFPFASFRIDALADYLTEMRRQGFMFESMSSFNVLKFRPVKPRNDLKYVVLNHYFSHSGRRGKIRDWDIEFMKQRFPQFHREFNNQFELSSPGDAVKFTVYCSSVISDEDIEALKMFRKKRLRKINVFKTVLYLYIVVLFTVLCVLALIPKR